MTGRTTIDAATGSALGPLDAGAAAEDRLAAPSAEAPGVEIRPAATGPDIRVADPRRVRMARRMLRELAPLMGDEAPELVLGDGSLGVQVMAPPAGRTRVVIDGPDALGRLLWPLTPDALAEGYLRGDLDIEGDVVAAVEAGQRVDPRRLDWTARRRLLRWGLELRRRTPTGRTLVRAARLRGRPHSRARDLEAIRFHYDVGEDFFRLWLDRRLTYSCAYFETPDTPLDAAQEAKLELVARKLRLTPGGRVLDIGCGWGSFIGLAAERFGVEAIGVTLSELQAERANADARARGRDVRALALDYRDLGELGSFDAIASIGMFEHVGRPNLGPYFRSAFEALRPGGLFLNHAIAATTDERSNPRGGFVDRYVFPDGELVPIDVTIRAARQAGFEVLDLQSLRPHYALTLAAWVQRLEASWDAAVAAAGPEVARTWRLYLSGARSGFDRGSLEVYQLLLARPALGGPAARPLRPWW